MLRRVLLASVAVVALATFFVTPGRVGKAIPAVRHKGRLVLGQPTIH